MIVQKAEQGSDEWFAFRLGKPSASSFGKLITRTGKPSSSSTGYINNLIYESISGEVVRGHVSDAMVRGTELEPLARENYEFLSGSEVKQVGFITDDDCTYGCSPDGLIGDDGGLEIKCPMGATMVKYLRDPEELVKAYWQQIQGSMWVTGRSWWDAFAFHPNTPHVLLRVERDEEYIAKLADEVLSAVNEIQREVEKHK
tara:strand:- start:12093 stop:12692 length:600 start_codon:yes stop_codon:yes gene_type:complete